MFGERGWLRTPLGDFRLTVNRGQRRLLSPEEREHALRVWFFAQAELESLSARAVAAAFELSTELRGAWTRVPPRQVDHAVAQGLARELERALLSGRLVLEERPRGGGEVGLEPQEPAPKWEPKPEEPKPEGAWIELELRDQRGEPVANRRFRVLQQGRVVREGTTNDTGFVRVENLGPGACEVEFPDFNMTDFNYQPALPGGA